MIMINVWDLPRYGFPRSTLERCLYDLDPEFEWIKGALIFREGYAKPKLDLEKFLALYREYRNRCLDREIVELEKKVVELEKSRPSLDLAIEAILAKHVELNRPEVSHEERHREPIESPDRANRETGECGQRVGEWVNSISTGDGRKERMTARVACSGVISNRARDESEQNWISQY